MKIKMLLAAAAIAVSGVLATGDISPVVKAQK